MIHVLGSAAVPFRTPFLFAHPSFSDSRPFVDKPGYVSKSPYEGKSALRREPKPSRFSWSPPAPPPVTWLPGQLPPFLFRHFLKCYCRGQELTTKGEAESARTRFRAPTNALATPLAITNALVEPLAEPSGALAKPLWSHVETTGALAKPL